MDFNVGEMAADVVRAGRADAERDWAPFGASVYALSEALVAVRAEASRLKIENERLYAVVGAAGELRDGDGPDCFPRSDLWSAVDDLRKLVTP